jgi:hypothetical protein
MTGRSFACQGTLRVLFVLATGLLGLGLVSCGDGPGQNTQANELSYRTALASVNATQAARNASLDREPMATPSDPARLARVITSVASMLESYQRDLEQLNAPADVADQHRGMVSATQRAIADANALVDGLKASGNSEKNIPLLQALSNDYAAFEAACRELNSLGFDCGSLIEQRLSNQP